MAAVVVATEMANFQQQAGLEPAASRLGAAALAQSARAAGIPYATEIAQTMGPQDSTVTH